MTWQYIANVEIFNDAAGYVQHQADQPTRFVAFSNGRPGLVAIGTYDGIVGPRNYAIYNHTNGSFDGIAGHGKVESLQIDPLACQRLAAVQELTMVNRDLETRLAPVVASLQRMMQ